MMPLGLIAYTYPEPVQPHLNWWWVGFSVAVILFVIGFITLFIISHSWKSSIKYGAVPYNPPSEPKRCAEHNRLQCWYCSTANPSSWSGAP